MTDEQTTVKFAQERLEEWAAWMRALPGVALGYQQSGYIATSGYSPVFDTESDARAQEVERIVCKLKQLRPSLYKAVVQWYVQRNPVALGAKVCGCAERVFRDRLRLAEMFVAGRLLG